MRGPWAVLAALMLAAGVTDGCGHRSRTPGTAEFPGRLSADRSGPGGARMSPVASAPTTGAAAPGSPAGESAGTATSWRRPADEPAPTELAADVDGDGSPDRVWVTTAKGKTNTESRAYLEANISGVHCKLGPYEALGLARPVAVRRLPRELDDLQLLPPTSLGLADVNLDGVKEVVARLSVPRSGGATLAIVLAWDRKQRRLRQIWDIETQALLCTETTGSGRAAMVSFMVVANKLPVPLSISAWDGERFVPAAPALPKGLAQALLPLYQVDWLGFGPFDGPSVLEGYTAEAVGVGDALDAVDRLGQALTRVDELGSDSGQARGRILKSLAVAQVAAGDEDGAKATLSDAAAPQHGGIRHSEVELALGLMSAYSTAGKREKALWWVDRAEELAGTPGAYQRNREYLETVPMLNEEQ